MELIILIAILPIALVVFGGMAYFNGDLTLPHQLPWNRKQEEVPYKFLDASREWRAKEEAALAAFERQLNPPPPVEPDSQFSLEMKRAMNAQKVLGGTQYMTATDYMGMMLDSGYEVRSRPVEREIKMPGFHQGSLAMYAPPVGDMAMAVPQDPQQKMIAEWGGAVIANNRRHREENAKLRAELEQANKKLKAIERWSFSPNPYLIPSSNPMLTFQDYVERYEKKGQYDGPW